MPKRNFYKEVLRRTWNYSAVKLRCSANERPHLFVLGFLGIFFYRSNEAVEKNAAKINFLDIIGYLEEKYNMNNYNVINFISMLISKF